MQVSEAMQTYHYHIKLELYPGPDPTAAAACNWSRRDQADAIWLPTAESSIFDDLTSHERKRPRYSSRANLQENRKGGKQLQFLGEIPELAQRESETREQIPTCTSGVIDCGATRAPTHDDETDRNVVFLSERQWRARSESFPPPGFAAGIGPRTAAKDWRFGRVNIESYDLGEGQRPENIAAEEQRTSRGQGTASTMPVQGESLKAAPAASLGPNLGGPGQATKARYVSLETKNTEAGWGIVHLYREGIDIYSTAPKGASNAGGQEGESSSANGSTDGEDGTILCIPSVPSYLSPSDFLGFIGEKWRGDVNHYRMIMTSSMSRYMVLMKFRDPGRARNWRKEFDGKVFSNAEICHVTFIKSITIETPNSTRAEGAESNGGLYPSSSNGVVNSLKPFPPPTPDLIEMPTCAVCLERMDDTAGLMAITCQHVFHCTCLQTWKGQGCPVCRATNPRPNPDSYDPNNPYTQPFGNGVSNLCSVCDCASDLWICLICGNVGCGRYKGGHAKDHWKETAHSFSLELETQHVWDYAGDMWVHRLIREKGDGKVVELPSNDRAARYPGRGPAAGDEDVVPRAKLDSIGMEYTHLLTSQLESQRLYFEEMVKKAADKAAQAAAAAESAKTTAQTALRELAEVKADQRLMKEETIPSLEKDLERERNRAAKSAELARKLSKSLQDEKEVSQGLMTRIEHVNKEMQVFKKQVDQLKTENAELQEMNRDLTMFISGQEKLKELESEGKLEQGELEEGTASVAEEKRKRKGKGRARK